MRILVTKLGDEIVKLMTEENISAKKISLEKQANINTTKINNINSSNSNNLTNGFNKVVQMKRPTRSRNKSNISSKNNLSISANKSTSSKFAENLLSKFDQDQTKLTSENLFNSKVISIKQKKLNIPKNVTEKYNSDNKSGFILPSVTLPKFKEKKKSVFELMINDINDTNNNNNFSPFNTNNLANTMKNPFFTFRDTLEDTVYIDLKKRLIFDKKIKDKLSRIDETKFRSVYGEKNCIEKLDEMLSSEINSDRINLINYLNKKKDISDVLVKRLSEYSEDKINKVNKICQIVFFNEERSQIFKERINDRIAAKKKRENTEYKTTIEDLGDNIKNIGDILKCYESNKDKKGKYRDIHSDIVNKFWKKYKVERYEKNTAFSRSQSSRFDDNHGTNSFGIKKGNISREFN